MHFDKMFDLAEERSLAKGTSIFYELEKIPGYSESSANYNATLSQAVDNGLVSIDSYGIPSATEFALEQIEKENNVSIGGSLRNNQRGYFSFGSFGRRKRSETEGNLKDLDVYGLNQPSTLRKIAAGAAVGIFVAAAGAAMLAHNSAAEVSYPTSEKILSGSNILDFKISPVGDKIVYNAGGVLKEFNLNTKTTSVVDSGDFEYDGQIIKDQTSEGRFVFSGHDDIIFRDLHNLNSSEIKIKSSTGTETLLSSNKGILSAFSIVSGVLIYTENVFDSSLSKVETSKLIARSGDGHSKTLVSLSSPIFVEKEIRDVKVSPDGSIIGFMENWYNRNSGSGSQHLKSIMSDGSGLTSIKTSDSTINFNVDSENKIIWYEDVNKDIEFPAYGKVSFINSGELDRVDLTQPDSDTEYLIKDFYVIDHEWSNGKLFFSTSDGIYKLDTSKINHEPKIFHRTQSPDFPNVNARVGERFYFDFYATDEDRDALTFSDDSQLFNINSQTGDIDWTPKSSDVGEHVVNIKISDGKSSVETYLDINVLPSVASATSAHNVVPKNNNPEIAHPENSFSFAPYLAIGLVGTGIAAEGIYLWNKKRRERNRGFQPVNDRPSLYASPHFAPQFVSATSQPQNWPPPVPDNYRKGSVAPAVSQPPPVNFSNHTPPRIVMQTAVAPAPPPAPPISHISSPQQQPDPPPPKILEMMISPQAVDDFAEFYGVRPKLGKYGHFILAKPGDIPKIEEDFKEFQRKKFGW